MARLSARVSSGRRQDPTGRSSNRRGRTEARAYEIPRKAEPDGIAKLFRFGVNRNQALTSKPPHHSPKKKAARRRPSSNRKIPAAGLESVFERSMPPDLIRGGY